MIEGAWGSGSLRSGQQVEERVGGWGRGEGEERGRGVDERGKSGSRGCRYVQGILALTLTCFSPSYYMRV